MITTPSTRWFIGRPWVLALLGAAALWFWWVHEPGRPLTLRVPGTDQQPSQATDPTGNPVLIGVLSPGPGQPASLPGSWPQFRGPERSGLPTDAAALTSEWLPGGPRKLWAVTVGEGYAGPVVSEGRVFLMDYDRETQHDALRCLSLADGTEIWRFGYPVSVKRNHGMSRTVPAVSSNRVVALGPKCHVVCSDTVTGELRWGLDLVRDHGAAIPPWYAGQCPLIQGDQVILAPGGPEALLMGVDMETGEVLWKTPNPRGWKMTHSSVTAMPVNGQDTYVYCASGGVVGVSAKDGQLLWETPAWKISIAMVPSPVVIPGDRLFLCGGYNAGSLMLKLDITPDGIRPVEEFRLKASAFGATQHTPVLYENHLYGIHPDGPLVCLNLQGETLWSSETETFGLGPLLIADGKIFALNDTGTLTLAEATANSYRPLAQSEVLHGHEAWAPMALAANRLLLRDLTELVCVDVGESR